MTVKEPRRGCFRHLSGLRPRKGVWDWSRACRGQDLLKECYEEIRICGSNVGFPGLLPVSLGT